ncbi:hypothetical protein QFC19_008751 [Naganishia cerealis]|uniref:Uncharacterized protein n=1 Tax=Naganishia cerealis TaxID=610337 RepID=A0ACC2UZA5_9TREE|nr:hypothetical protein QFC19_008751 [Naganishia cerealis]
MSEPGPGNTPPVPVLSPVPQRFGSRTQHVIDDVEEMLEDLQARSRARADATRGERQFPPPILATTGGEASSRQSPRLRTGWHGRSYSGTSSSNSTHGGTPFVTPPPYSPTYSAPSPSTSPSGPRNRYAEAGPARRTSPLKHGFLASFDDGDPAAAEENKEERENETGNSMERQPSSTPVVDDQDSELHQFPPLKLATARAREEKQHVDHHLQQQEREEDTNTTPRAPTDHLRTPGKPTAFSRAWLDPASWAAKGEEEVHEGVHGWGMVKKREMTPVEERTEGSRDSAGSEKRRGDEGDEYSADARLVLFSFAAMPPKPLPTTPTSSTGSLLNRRHPQVSSTPSTQDPTPTTPRRAPAAASLIAFFESATATPTQASHPGKGKRRVTEDTVNRGKGRAWGHDGRGTSEYTVPLRFCDEQDLFSAGGTAGEETPTTSALHVRSASVPDHLFSGSTHSAGVAAGARNDEEVGDEEWEHARTREAAVGEGDRDSDTGTAIRPCDSASEVFRATTTPAPALGPAPAYGGTQESLTAKGAPLRMIGIVGGGGRERDTSPLRNVRNVVAAWRGRLAPPITPQVYDTPALRIGTAGRGGGVSILAGEGRTDRGEGEGEGKDRNVFEEAFFTIRRMSTRRRGGSGGKKRAMETGQIAEQEEKDNEKPLGKEKPLPALRLAAGGEEESSTTGREVRGKLVSVVSEITSEPLRLGELWYLNVHDPSEEYKWIKCDAQLFADRLILTWIPEFGDGSRGFITLDLVHCLEVRSIPSPNHPSAASDIGSIAAKAVPDLGNNLYPFQLVYDDGVERLGSESARDRVRWVSAIWDVLERMPGELEVDEDTAASSENGSRSTVFQPPEALAQDMMTDIPTRPRLLFPDHRFSRVSDDFYLGDSQTGVLPLKRSSSKQLGRSPGSLLRRVASEADLDLDALASGPANLVGSRHSPDHAASLGTAGGGASDVSIRSMPRMTPLSRLQPSTVSGGTGSRYETAFSVTGLTAGQEGVEGSSIRSVISRTMPSSFSSNSSESSERLPSYSSAVTVLPVRELETRPFVSGLPSPYRDSEFASPAESPRAIIPPRLPPRRQVLSRDSARVPSRPLVEALPSGTAMEFYDAVNGPASPSLNTPIANPVGPRPQLRPAPLSMHSDYFTATEGSRSYYTSQSVPPSRLFSITPSSVSHAASSLDRMTPVTTPTASGKASSENTRSGRGSKSGGSRIPVPSFPSSSSSSSSSTTRTPSSSTSSSTTRPIASQMGAVSPTPSLSPLLLETVVGNEQARINDTRSITSQLDRIETAVADIGTFLSIPPVLPSKEAIVPGTQAGAASMGHGQPSSPSSSSSSSSSSSDTPTQPGTPVEDARIFRDLASIKQQNSTLLEQQQKLQDILEGGDLTKDRAPTLHRLEDLLLRLLVRTGDSEILVEMGREDPLPRQQGRRAPSSFATHSQRTSGSIIDSGYSDEEGFKAPAPAPSVDSEYERRRQARMSGLPDSLLQSSPRLSEELDEEWEMQNLPPPSPDVDLEPRPRAMPPHIVTRRTAQAQFGYDSDSVSESSTATPVGPLQPTNNGVDRVEATPRLVQRPSINQRPLTPETESDTTTTSTSPSPLRRHFRPGPFPQPVGIPSPVRPEGYPSVMPPPSFRPGFRPSRMGGVREPMTTT